MSRMSSMGSGTCGSSLTHFSLPKSAILCFLLSEYFSRSST
eukprot:05860.XXX_255705_255827_1 [CDS] Oithona nana genome sequencing.